jgi:hypothetical protein
MKSMWMNRSVKRKKALRLAVQSSGGAKWMVAVWGVWVLALGVAGGLVGCGDDDSVAEPECGDGVCAAGETAEGCPQDCASRCGDGVCDAEETAEGCPQDCAPSCGDGVCFAPEETWTNCPTDCPPCEPLEDVSDLIGDRKLFFGYAVLGRNCAEPSCGVRPEANELYVSWTPPASGEMVLSTVHPSTHSDTVLEVRQETFDGSALGCNDDASQEVTGSKLQVAVEAHRQYVAMVETADDASGIFALGLHWAGVCEGAGEVAEITPDLLTGHVFAVDTDASTASLGGRCGGGDPGAGSTDPTPEALLTFTAPRSGEMVATTVLPETTFDTLLHVRRQDSFGGCLCDSPEAEIGCVNDSEPWGTASVLRFTVAAESVYHLFVDGGAAGARGQAGLLLGYAAASPAAAALEGCDHETIQDRFVFFAQSGQQVYVNADTVDAATAADLRLRVRRPDGSELYEADDDFECTYPPPSYSCPEHTFSADANGLYTVEIYVGMSESCTDYSRANYALTVEIDETAAELILVKDQ